MFNLLKSFFEPKIEKTNAEINGWDEEEFTYTRYSDLQTVESNYSGTVYTASGILMLSPSGLAIHPSWGIGSWGINENVG